MTGERVMTHTELNDLIIRARQNDKQAIIQLYRESCDRVYFYCCKTLKTPSEAAAAVYEIFSKLFKSIDKTDSPEAYYMELNSIMVQVCKSGPDKAFDLSNEEALLAKETAAELNSGDTEQIIQKIDSLPERQKRIAILFHYENLTAEQIAEIEGITENEVQDELNHAAEAICGSQNTDVANALSISAGATCLLENIRGAIIENITKDMEFKPETIYSKLKKPVFLKLKLWHVLIALLVIAAAVVYICIEAKTQTVPTEAGDYYMTVSMADFSDEIRQQAVYYSTGFYDRLDIKVTPEMAYLRTAGGYTYYEDNWLSPIEEQLDICWYGNNTNILCLFDKDKAPIAYIYGFSPNSDNPEDYPKELKVHTGFEVDCKAVMDKAVSDTEEMMKDIYVLDEEDICCSFSEANDAYIFDINYDSVPFTRDEVDRDKILYTDVGLDKASEAFTLVLAQYWLEEGKIWGEETYDLKDRGLNIIGYGEYYCKNKEQEYDHIFVAIFDKDKPIAAGYLDTAKMNIPDYEN